jgi:3-oxoadipate enol-lactonase
MRQPRLGSHDRLVGDEREEAEMVDGWAAAATTADGDAVPGSDMVSVRDTRLYVEDAGAGPTLLFIHGMCGDAHVWQGQVRRLGSRFRCVTYDRRGHTRSPRGEAPESVQTHAEDAAALIRALGVRPVVVGSSGGARIGLELSRRHPDLVAGAVLSEPPVPSLVPEIGARFLSEVGAAVKPAVAAGGPRAAVDAFFMAVCPGLWSTLDDSGKEPYRANAEMMLAEFAGPSYELHHADLAQIAVPSLFLHGDLSHPMFRAAARVLANGVPHARLREITGSGHVTYAEQPDEFSNAVNDFVTALTNSSPIRES